MKGGWTGSLGVALGLVMAGAHGEDLQWRPATPRSMPPASSAEPKSSQPPLVILGRPVPLESPPDARMDSPFFSDAQVKPVAYQGAQLGPPQPLVRAQSPEGGSPPPSPPAGSALPPTGSAIPTVGG